MVLERLDGALGIVCTVAICGEELTRYATLLEICNESLRCGVVGNFVSRN